MSRYIALATAVLAESEDVIRSLKDSEKLIVGRRQVYKGRLFGKSVVVVNTGVGKTNAAQAVTAMLENVEIETIIVGGCGGAYPSSRLGVGDIAVATEEIYGEEGVFIPDGWQSMEYIGVPLLEKRKKRYFNRFPLDKQMVEKAVETAKRLPAFSKGSSKPRILCGPFITVSQISGSREIGEQLCQRFQAICENMEGAATAHICTLYGIPFLEIRGISNMVEDRKPANWNKGIASKNMQVAILGMLKNWEEIVCNR